MLFTRRELRPIWVSPRGILFVKDRSGEARGNHLHDLYRQHI